MTMEEKKQPRRSFYLWLGRRGAGPRPSSVVTITLIILLVLVPLAILAGISAFGILGVILGPVVAAILFSMLESWRVKQSVVEGAKC